MNGFLKLFGLALAGAAVFGCSGPEHVEKPLKERPPVTDDFTKIKTPEQKIEFIQNSKAPDSEKKKAIERVKNGQL